MPVIYYPELVFQPHPSDSRFIDLTGRVFGRLTVIGYAPSKKRHSRWFCLCSCGSVMHTLAEALHRGSVLSCGCYQRECLASRNLKHGHLSRNKRLPECDIWRGMKIRCQNPQDRAFRDYGGRGITVCERWNHFENFYADMGPRPSPYHSIDRIDNDGNYEPGNCRWATREQQMRNRRDNRWITFEGETLCISDWAKRIGISLTSIRYRLRTGWSLFDTLTSPAKRVHTRGSR